MHRSTKLLCGPLKDSALWKLIFFFWIYPQAVYSLLQIANLISKSVQIGLINSTLTYSDHWLARDYNQLFVSCKPPPSHEALNTPSSKWCLQAIAACDNTSTFARDTHFDFLFFPPVGRTTTSLSNVGHSSRPTMIRNRWPRRSCILYLTQFYWHRSPFPHRKTSKKPSHAFIGHFQQTYPDALQQPASSEQHPEQPEAANDIPLDRIQCVRNAIRTPHRLWRLI